MFRAPLPFLGFHASGEEATVLPSLALPVSAAQFGICIIVSDPIAMTNRRRYIESITTYDSYTHQTKAIGGYFSAEIVFKSKVSDISSWLLKGIGRHVDVYDHAQKKIWEGLVNQIVVTVGGLEYTVGPLLGGDVTNKVASSYNAVDYNIYPPATGIKLKTAASENESSQARYGILERVLEINEVTETGARYDRDSWIGIHAFPKVSVRPSFSESADISISLSCLGYWAYLEAYTVTETDVGGVAISDKIIATMDANPNASIFSDEYAYVTTNSAEVRASEDGSRTGAAILSELATFGDSSNTRYNVGIYNDRKLHYTIAPSVIDYYKYFDARATSLNGSTLHPWNVYPGKWILHSGFLFISEIPRTFAALSTSDSVGYIEGVTFTAPFGLDIETVKVKGIDQLLARVGIGSL
jgi:hypothetical protein